MKTSLIVLLLGIVILSSVFISSQHTESENDQSSNYSFFTFAVEWPASVCMTQSCKSQYMEDNDGTHFNVHGLWPNGIGSDYCAYPATCSSVKYNENLIYSDTRTWMRKWYAGLYSNSTDFHAHEFEKHGTCWNSTSTDLRVWENEFFSQIKLQSDFYDVLLAFKQKSIVPSDSKTYQYNDFAKAIKDYFLRDDFGVLLFCNKINNNYYLFQIELCLDLKYQPSPCLCSKASDSCPKSKDIYLPVWKGSPKHEQVSLSEN